MNAYDKAWQIPGPDDGVLVEREDQSGPYWWVICPATATIVTSPTQAELCAYNSCPFDDIHWEAARMIRRRAERRS